MAAGGLGQRGRGGEREKEREGEESSEEKERGMREEREEGEREGGRADHCGGRRGGAGSVSVQFEFERAEGRTAWCVSGEGECV